MMTYERLPDILPPLPGDFSPHAYHVDVSTSRAVVLAWSPSKKEYATWRCYLGKPGWFWGHYFMLNPYNPQDTQREARADYAERIAESL